MKRDMRDRSSMEALESRWLMAAVAGAYDPSFGPDGRGWVSTEVPYPTGSGATRMFQQPDGKIALSCSTGDQGLMRFNTDGSLDQSFGVLGQVDAREFGDINAIAPESDGRILVVGHEFDATSFRVTRVNLDGTIDPTFGDAGAMTVAFPAAMQAGVKISAAAVDPLGRIVIGGSYNTGENLFAGRLTPQGLPDTTFGGDGFAVLEQSGSQSAGPMVVQPDGRIVLGTAQWTTETVVRFATDGSIDTSFGSGGLLTMPGGSFGYLVTMTQDATGRLYLLGDGMAYGYSGFDAHVARYTADGQLDTTFNGGHVSFSLYTNSNVNTDPHGIAVDAQGRVLVGGTIEMNPDRFAVARLTPQGYLDTTFDADGRAWMDMPGGGQCSLVSADASGRVIAVGDTNDSAIQDQDRHPAVVRFTVTGAVDSSFGDSGAVTVQCTARSNDLPVAVQRQIDGKLLVLGNLDGYTVTYQNYCALTRFKIDGSVDESFGKYGTLSLNGYAYGLAMWGVKPIVLTGKSVYRLNPDGTPDTTFSDDGIATLPVTYQSHVEVDSLGRIYTSGPSSLSRLTADGTVDTSFGTDGTLQLPTRSGNNSADGLIVQPDDKVLIGAGDLYRVLPDGTLDPSFAGGMGAPAPSSIGSAFTETADGSVLFASTGPGSGGLYSWDVNLRRYDADGNLDMAFADGTGVAVANILGSDWEENVKGITSYPDGTSVLVVDLENYGHNETSPGSALVQFTPGGQLDPALDSDGILLLPASSQDGNPIFTQTVDIDPLGRILALGSRWATTADGGVNSDIVLGRFNGRHDVDPPHILRAEVVDDSAQLKLRFDFDEKLADSLDAADLALRPMDDSSATPVYPNSFSLDVQSNSATAVFAVGAVPAGAYRAILSAGGVKDVAGNMMTADYPFDLIFVPTGSKLSLAESATTRVNGIGIGGQLDLRDGTLVIDYSGQSPFNDASSLIQSGRNGGSWNGNGIITSSASENRTTLGIAEASDVLGISGSQTAMFDGEIVDATSLIVKYTYGGDANLDGRINIDDYGRIDSYVGQSGAVFGWFNGDFNYDGKINIDDYGIIDSNIGAQGSPLGVENSESGIQSSEVVESSEGGVQSLGIGGVFQSSTMVDQLDGLKKPADGELISLVE